MRITRRTFNTVLGAAAAAMAAPRIGFAEETGERGGVLTYFNRIDPPGFDLHSFLSHAPLFVAPVFNNLVRFDNSKSDLSPANIVPDLAERWEIGADGLTYTFYLRPGVKWHDGAPFTADDAKYSLDKMVDPERSAISQVFTGFDRAEVVDPTTLRVHLKFAQASFLSMLGTVYAVMQPAHNSAADGKSVEHLIGTGPFKFREHQAGISFDLERNADYFKPGLPYLDGIKILIVPEEQASVAAFVGRRVHMSHPSTAWRNDEVLATIQQSAAEATTVIKGSPRANSFWLNTRTLQDVRIRRALALVMSQEEVIVAAYGSVQWGSLGQAVFPPPWTVGPDGINAAAGWDKPQEERIAEAKKLLAEVSAEGLKLRLLGRSGVPESERVLSYLSDIWRRHLGLESEVVIKELSEVVEQRDAGEFELYIESVYAAVGDPDEFASYFVTEGTNNFTGYSNAEVDDLFTQQSRAGDFATRQALAQRIEAAIVADMPIIPSGLFQKFGVSWWPAVQNYSTHPTPFSTNLQMEQVWLKQSEDFLR